MDTQNDTSTVKTHLNLLTFIGKGDGKRANQYHKEAYDKTIRIHDG